MCCAVKETKGPILDAFFTREKEKKKKNKDSAEGEKSDPPRVMKRTRIDSSASRYLNIASDLFPACDAPRRRGASRAEEYTRKKERRRRRHCARIWREREREEASRRIDTAMIVGGVDPHLRSSVRPSRKSTPRGVTREREFCQEEEAKDRSRFSFIFYGSYGNERST